MAEAERSVVEMAVIDCVALFYEVGQGGENYRKKKKKTSLGVG